MHLAVIFKGVPDGRRLRHVNVICVHSNHMCRQEGEKRGRWGVRKGTKNGAVDSEHGASKSRRLQLCTKSHHPSKRVIHTLNIPKM
jgi:hypothetical protein